MIVYESNDVKASARIEGSNIPRAVLYTMPSVALAVIVNVVLSHFDELDFMKKVSLSSVWSATVIVLGVLLGMRTNAAYARFWEGITLVQLMRAEWLEATRNLVAFSLVAAKSKPNDTKICTDVKDFQFTLIRLMSLMHGASLRQIGGHEEEFEVLDIEALDGESLTYLANAENNSVNPVEVLLQWIQVLITDHATKGTIAVPPPILTRVYQTLSRGMVNLHNARKLAECPFPFPLFQMVCALLLLQSIMTPVFVAGSIDNPVFAACITFVPIFGMWSITFTASELEQPFGNDPNDLPLQSLQKGYNTSLLMLLDKETSRAPMLSPDSPKSVDKLRKKQRFLSRSTSSMTNTLPQAEILEEPNEDESWSNSTPPDDLKETVADGLGVEGNADVNIKVDGCNVSGSPRQSSKDHHSSKGRRCSRDRSMDRPTAEERKAEEQTSDTSAPPKSKVKVKDKRNLELASTDTPDPQQNRELFLQSLSGKCDDQVAVETGKEHGKWNSGILSLGDEFMDEAPGSARTKRLSLGEELMDEAPGSGRTKQSHHSQPSGNTKQSQGAERTELFVF